MRLTVIAILLSLTLGCTQSAPPVAAKADVSVLDLVDDAPAKTPSIQEQADEAQRRHHPKESAVSKEDLISP